MTTHAIDHPGALVLPPRLDAALSVAERITRMLALGRSWCGQTETPSGSNRGPLPDLVLRTAGTGVGQPWCAATSYTLRWWARLWVPPQDGASCDAWRHYAARVAGVSAFDGKPGLWRPAGDLALSDAPAGSTALYTSWRKLPSGPYAGRYDAEHAGTLCAPDPHGRERTDLEGNTSCAFYQRNGDTMCCKPVHTERLYGLVLPA